jgi:hypothetical protein
VGKVEAEGETVRMGRVGRRVRLLEEEIPLGAEVGVDAIEKLGRLAEPHLKLFEVEPRV